jgi:lipoprotein-releasing system permease protein
VLLKGIAPSSTLPVTDVSKHLCKPQHLPQRCVLFSVTASDFGSLLSHQENTPPVLIGYELYKKLDMPVGSVISLTTPVGIAAAQGHTPKRLYFRLAGVFKSGMHEFDARLVYTHLRDAQTLFGMGETVTGLEFKITDPQHVDRYAPALIKAAGGYPYRTMDWRELNAGIFTALKLQKTVMFLVLTCIVIVASFNIASTLFMAVLQKSQDIAVMKSMGAYDSSVMRIFVLQGWITGLCGTVLGTVLGLIAAYALSKVHIAIAADVYMVDHLEVHISALEVFYTGVMTLLICHLSTLYPALKAAQQLPVDALKETA